MLTNLKALVVILLIALPMFAICKSLCLQYMTPGSFQLRRNVWLALTVVAFASPSFWLYALFAIVLLIWASQHDENPLALYVLVTFAIPDVRAYIPVILINQLFDLTQYRILSLFLVIPAIISKSQYSAERNRIFLAPGVLLAAFIILQIVVLVPYETVTHTMRRTFLYAIDTFVIFFAFSRLKDRADVADVMSCFFLACALMAPIALFETSRTWLLYTGLAMQWGDPNGLAWLFRGDSLRAQVAAGHSINLGYHLAMGLGLYLYLRGRRTSRIPDALILLALVGGIFVTHSRGAWVTAAAAVVVFTCLRPNASRHLPRALFAAVCVGGLLYVSPLKESFLDRLPFIGVADQDTIEYRQRLAEISWDLIKQHPIFGDPFYFLHMESLRAQGIIDIVNGYLFATLFTGFVGVTLLVSVFALSMWQGLRVCLRERQRQEDFALMGASLAACMIATLIYIGTAGYGTTTYVLCGLLLSYAASGSARLPNFSPSREPVSNSPFRTAARPLS